MSYLNSDMKSWSIGTVHARSHDDRSYEILTENGNLISRNHVHLRPTNVQPVDKTTKPGKVNARVDTSPKASGIHTSHNHEKSQRQRQIGLLLKMPKLMMFLIEPDLVERFKYLLTTKNN